MAPGSHVAALNGYKWSKELLHDTLAARADTPAAPAKNARPMVLLIQKDDMFKTFELDYSGGERYPNLVRESGSSDLLAQIARPRTATGESASGHDAGWMSE
jgi:hypothetical protein